jgi:hypothetical protein
LESAAAETTPPRIKGMTAAKDRISDAQVWAASRFVDRRESAAVISSQRTAATGENHDDGNKLNAKRNVYV